MDKTTMGMSMKNIPPMKEMADRIVSMFDTAIKNKKHLDPSGCPVLSERLSILPQDISSEDMAKFMISLFWAPQANTLPITFWALGNILADPKIYANAVADALKGDDSSSNENEMSYIDACVRETTRVYIANITHRRVSEDIRVTTSSGSTYKIPKGDMLTTASYLQHYNPETYDDPEKFDPERWLGKSDSDFPLHHW